MDLYSELGVKKDASQAEIEKAGKQRARETHPDLHGEESTAAFQKVSHALSVLRDPQKRERYDQTGNDGGSDPFAHEDAVAMNLVSQKLAQIVNGGEDPRYVDVVGQIKRMIASDRQQLEASIAGGNQAIERLAKFAARVSHRGEGPNVMGSFFEQQKREMSARIEAQESAMKVCAKAAEMVEEYCYAVDAPEVPGLGPAWENELGKAMERDLMEAARRKVYGRGGLFG